MTCTRERLANRFMKLTTLRNVLLLFVCLATVAVVCWGQISESFGPMKQTERQCLICQRNRVEKWVCGSKIVDEITNNEYSDWIDTFTPLDHRHVWYGHTRHDRTYWSGSKTIACGGIPAIPRIFEQRSGLGELDAQYLAVRFHQLVESDFGKFDVTELDTFANLVVDNPESLLRNNTLD